MIAEPEKRLNPTDETSLFCIISPVLIAFWPMRTLQQCVAIVFAAVLSVNVASAQSIRVGIPERNNLQYISFWIAQGAGLFKAEGLDIEIVVPDAPNMSGMILMQRRVDVALLQPPVYLGLIAEQHPFVLFANLLANDPINLIVRADVAAKLKLDPKAPLVDRLKALKGSPDRRRPRTASADAHPVRGSGHECRSGRTDRHSPRRGSDRSVDHQRRRRALHAHAVPRGRGSSVSAW